MTIGRTMPRNGIRPAPVGALAIAGAPVLQPGNRLDNGDFSSNPGGWSFFQASIVSGALKWNVPGGSYDNGDETGRATHSLNTNIPAGTQTRITLTRANMLARTQVYLKSATGSFSSSRYIAAGSGTAFIEVTPSFVATQVELYTDGDDLGTIYRETGTIDDIIVQVYA